MIIYHLIPDNDIDQVAKLKDYCFKTSLDSSSSRTFRYWVKRSAALGAYDNQKLASQLLILPFQMNVFGETYEMGGIATVSTYPEYRQGGVTKELILRALRQMKENKQSISVLSPFAVSFYRKFGWEVFFENVRYTIPAEELILKKRVQGKIIRVDYESTNAEKWMKKIHAFHADQAAERHGHQYRELMWWERIKERNPKTNYAISLDEEEQIQGYIRYEIEKQEFQVKDFYTVNQKTEQLLWQFIQTHASQIDTVTGTSPMQDAFSFHLGRPEVKKEVFYDKMVRVVDVEAFLRQYPFASLEEPLYIEIKDKDADWNNGLFKIKNANSVEKITSAPKEKVLHMEIGPFSAMMVGYHQLEWYRKNGYAEGSEEAASTWQAAIPKGYPSYNDHF